MKRFENVECAYTGGGIWLFDGKLHDGTWFLTDDEGATLILDADPSDFDESLWEEWQNEHTVRELHNRERVEFCNALADRIQSDDSADAHGGITEKEVNRYRDFWAVPFEGETL